MHLYIKPMVYTELRRGTVAQLGSLYMENCAGEQNLEKGWNEHLRFVRR